jgi:glucose/arabinose dehydrogenase
MQAGLVLALAACGTSASTTAQPTASSDRPFTETPVATFDSPWAMDFIPGSGVRLTNVALVTEKGGKLWLVDVINGQKREVSGAPPVVVSGQGGFLDVVASPAFAGDQLIYLTYSEPENAGGSGLALARARLVMGTGAPRLEGLTVLWRDPAGGEGGQFGARIAFAPDGKSLFLSSGERQRFTPAQDPNQPLGKILHLTLDGKPAAGNPMAGRTGAATVTITDPPKDTEVAKTTSGKSFTWPRPNLTPAETWSTGHRNPLGLAFAQDGRLWETEMGPRGGDEVNLILPGKNYGWPTVSNGSNYDGVDIPDHRAGDGFEAPKVFWNPSISPVGLMFYTGNLFPQWNGDAFFGALSGQALMHVRISGDQATKADQWDMGHRIREVQQGPRGELYVLEDGEGARLLRLEPAQTRR